MATYPCHATYDLLLNRCAIGLDNQQPSNTIYPCDNSNPTNYIAFIDAVVAAVKASGVYVSYDIQNEPDGTGFWQRGINSPQYYQMWDTAVREIRRLQPNAWIIGPSFSNFYPARIQSWLAQVQTDGTLPTYLNWHFSDLVVQDGNTAAGLLSSAGITGVGLSMNECIIGASNQKTGLYGLVYMVQPAEIERHSMRRTPYGAICMTAVFARSSVERKSVSRALRGILEPTGQWWVMKALRRYERQCSEHTGNSSVDLYATTDSVSNKATILLGNSTVLLQVLRPGRNHR